MNPYVNYQENSVLTASPNRLVSLLYEGAIKNCNKGIIHIQKKNIKESHEAIIKAQNIMLELLNTLDMNIELSKQLQAMYTYIYELLVSANMSKSEEPLKEAVGYLKEFKEMWVQVTKRQDKD